MGRGALAAQRQGFGAWIFTRGARARAGRESAARRRAKAAARRHAPQTSANTPEPGRGTDADDGDPFIAIIKKYASFATAEAQRLKDVLDATEASYKALLVYLNIKPGKGQVPRGRAPLHGRCMVVAWWSL